MSDLPRHPIYIPTKGRCDSSLTARWLLRDEVPFRLIVEPSEYDIYAARFGIELLLALPRDDMKLVGARNWIMSHAIEEGHTWHWQIDDNIRGMKRRCKVNGEIKRKSFRAGPALATMEAFADSYKNIALIGPTYSMFLPDTRRSSPFRLNCHVYSCTLINHAIEPIRWRLVYNDDVDLCLQVLAAGWCTIQVQAFSVTKNRTMYNRGGNTPIYQGDGRLQMARSLERIWPRIVQVKRRFGRPQHVIDWRRFRTQLKPSAEREES